MASPYSGSMDALVTGVGEGLRLLANIVGMLIAFVALVFIVDKALGLFPVGGEPATLVGTFGWLLAPQSLWSGLLATCMTGTVIGLIA